MSSVFAADPVPGPGKLLVATELVRGLDFEESVILLVRYDENGVAGLIINKPTSATPKDALPELEELAHYDGNFYFGGPVGLSSIQALVRSGNPPNRSTHIIDDVYLAPITEELVAESANSSTLRFYVGYAGWSPAQLDWEMARGSWHVVPASADIVFAADPENLWGRLAPTATMRASAHQ